MTTENFYLTITIVLFVLQVYQLSVMNKLKSDVNELWNQLAFLSAITALKLKDMVLNKKQEIDESKKPEA